MAEDDRFITKINMDEVYVIINKRAKYPTYRDEELLCRMPVEDFIKMYNAQKEAKNG